MPQIFIFMLLDIQNMRVKQNLVGMQVGRLKSAPQTTLGKNFTKQGRKNLYAKSNDT